MNKKKKILVVFGTRPEAIKLAPLIKKLQQRDQFAVIVASTGQHKQQLKQVVDFFKIGTWYQAQLMNSNINDLRRGIIRFVQGIFRQQDIKLVIVQGDTTTAAMRALAAFYRRVPVVHVQAGLRTGDRNEPYPQQFNRKMISQVASFHFAPSQESFDNLRKYQGKKFMVGNTVVDALNLALKSMVLDFCDFFSGDIDQFILLTMHRRQSFGKPMQNVCQAVKILALEGYKFVIPVHLNAKVSQVIHGKLKDVKNVFLFKPFTYPQLIGAMKNCKFIMTDSGGIQQQAPTFGKYVFVLRDHTQRMQSIDLGFSELVGTGTDKIVNSVKNKVLPTITHNPYGDGNSSQTIVDILRSNEF